MLLGPLKSAQLGEMALKMKMWPTESSHYPTESSYWPVREKNLSSRNDASQAPRLKKLSINQEVERFAQSSFYEKDKNLRGILHRLR